MIARLMIRCSFLILVAILISSAQAFLSALIPRRHYNYCLSTTSAKNDEPGDANATARDVVVACMDGLLNNDKPWANAGLELCWDYSSDRNRAAQGGSFDEFMNYASNPTFSTMVDAKEYSIESVGKYIPGTNTRGAMQTVLVKVQSSKGEDRSFLW